MPGYLRGDAPLFSMETHRSLARVARAHSILSVSGVERRFPTFAAIRRVRSVWRLAGLGGILTKTREIEAETLQFRRQGIEFIQRPARH